MGLATWQAICGDCGWMGTVFYISTYPDAKVRADSEANQHNTTFGHNAQSV